MTVPNYIINLKMVDFNEYNFFQKLISMYNKMYLNICVLYYTIYILT